MTPHDLQSSNFFPTNRYNFADIITKKNLSLGLGLAVNPLSPNSDQDQFSPNNILITYPHNLSVDNILYCQQISYED